MRSAQLQSQEIIIKYDERIVSIVTVILENNTHMFGVSISPFNNTIGVGYSVVEFFEGWNEMILRSKVGVTDFRGRDAGEFVRNMVGIRKILLIINWLQTNQMNNERSFITIQLKMYGKKKLLFTQISTKGFSINLQWNKNDLKVKPYCCKKTTYRLYNIIILIINHLFISKMLPTYVLLLLYFKHRKV
jgi:hypothetical protein